jgi:glycosyltransferase involved in cell wall biosynthesis
MKKDKLSIVIPVFNEEKNILRFEKELIGELDKLKYSYQVIFIDDGSTDDSLKNLLELKIKYPQSIIISNRNNKGMGYSIRKGIQIASGNIVITLDSDLTFSPKEIPTLLNRFERGDVDCVIGSYIKGRTEEVNPIRLIFSKGVNLIYSLILGSRISCISPIFKLYKTKQLKQLKLTSNEFIINAEIVVKLLRSKKKFSEVPVTLTKRIYGESKINITKEIKNHLLFIVKVMKWRILG